MSPGTSLGQLSVFENKYTNKVVISKFVDKPFLGQGAQMRCNCSCLYFLQSQKCFWRFHGFKLFFSPHIVHKNGITVLWGALGQLRGPGDCSALKPELG